MQRGIGIQVCVGRSVYPWQVKAERRQRTPADLALISEGFGSETDPAGIEQKDDPAGFKIPAGCLDWTNQPSSDPRLSPRACAEPAGRFHRGATRGEVE